MYHELTPMSSAASRSPISRGRTRSMRYVRAPHQSAPAAHGGCLKPAVRADPSLRSGGGPTAARFPRSPAALLFRGPGHESGPLPTQPPGPSPPAARPAAGSGAAAARPAAAQERRISAESGKSREPEAREERRAAPRSTAIARTAAPLYSALKIARRAPPREPRGEGGSLAASQSTSGRRISPAPEAFLALPLDRRDSGREAAPPPPPRRLPYMVTRCLSGLRAGGGRGGREAAVAGGGELGRVC